MRHLGTLTVLALLVGICRSEWLNPFSMDPEEHRPATSDDGPGYVDYFQTEESTWQSPSSTETVEETAEADTVVPDKNPAVLTVTDTPVCTISDYSTECMKLLEKCETEKNSHIIKYSRLLKQCTSQSKRKDNDEALHFLIRFVNILLRTTGLQNLKLLQGKKRVRLDTEVTSEDLEVLQEFGKKNKGGWELSQLDEVISRVLLPETTKDETETMSIPKDFAFLDGFLGNIQPEKLLLLFNGFLALYSIYLLLLGSSVFRVISILGLLIFISAFNLNCILLYNEEIVKRRTLLMKYPRVPKECNPESLTYWESFLTLFHRKDKCLEYHEVKEIDPAVRIPLDHVFVTTVTNLSRVFAATGAILSDFCSNSTSFLPWPLNRIVSLLLMLLVVVFILVGLLYLISLRHNYDFKVWSLFAGLEIRKSVAGSTAPPPEQPSLRAQNQGVGELTGLVDRISERGDPYMLMNARMMRELLEAHSERSVKRVDLSPLTEAIPGGSKSDVKGLRGETRTGKVREVVPGDSSTRQVLMKTPQELTDSTWSGVLGRHHSSLGIKVSSHTQRPRKMSI